MNKREPTMTRALSMLQDGATIVETGCARHPDDGQSTLVFGRWAAEHDGCLWTIDIDIDNLHRAEVLTEPYKSAIKYIYGDSVKTLPALSYSADYRPFDLLYLDSLDYPYGELLDLYGGATDLGAAIATLTAMSEAEIVAAHGDLIAPSQEHAEREVIAALPHLSKRSLVLIDDAGLPGGGKARLAREVLVESGFECIADEYQTLWSR